MHYLVCGGAGFIGANLCRYLLKMGDTVTVWDNLCTGDKNKKQKNVTFVRKDIRDVIPCKTKFDGIFNLACPASPTKYQTNPQVTMETCVTGTINLLNTALYSDIPLVQASTSEVYGNSLKTPHQEDDPGVVNCTGIRACYDEGKRAAETLCFDHHRKKGTKIRVVRIFNTYGPFMSPDDGRIISNFITQALSGKPITVYGDGLQTRSFCYVDDTVLGLYLAMNSSVIGPVNIGNPDERSVLDVAKYISDIIPGSSIKYKHLPVDDPIKRCPDITRAKTLLGWLPKVSFSEGISRTIDYYTQTLTRIGIIGGGIVGQATALFSMIPNTTVLTYDINPDKCVPKNTTLNDLANCNFVFICVPTPPKASGECDTSIVEQAVSDLRMVCKDLEVPEPLILVRSTVSPGTCKRLDVLFFPEFLRENHWKEDFINTTSWMVGIPHFCPHEKITRLFTFLNSTRDHGFLSTANVSFASTDTVELVKYARNCFLATKVSFCNEIYQLCQALDISWNDVRNLFVSDTRIGESHTQVPGHDDKLGFGGNCLPKDTVALQQVFRQVQVPCHVLDGVINTNDLVRN